MMDNLAKLMEEPQKVFCVGFLIFLISCLVYSVYRIRKSKKCLETISKKETKDLNDEEIYFEILSLKQKVGADSFRIDYFSFYAVLFPLFFSIFSGMMSSGQSSLFSIASLWAPQSDPDGISDLIKILQEQSGKLGNIVISIGGISFITLAVAWVFSSVDGFIRAEQLKAFHDRIYLLECELKRREISKKESFFFKIRSKFFKE